MAERSDLPFEISGPTLKSSNVEADVILQGKMYMVTVSPHFRFPIHPEPDADHKIAKLVRQNEVIVATNDTIGAEPNVYRKTVLPVAGWIRESCIEDGTLVEITPKTYNQLVGEKEEEKSSFCFGCFDACLRNSACTRKIFISFRKHPVYVMAGFIILQFLAEVVVFLDLISDIGVAYTLSKADENWLFMLTCVFMLAPYYIAWAAAFGYLQKMAMESTAQNEGTMKIKKDDPAIDASDMADVKTADTDLENEDDGRVATVDEGGNTIDKKTPSKGPAPDKKIQILVIAFAIAPIGVMILVLLDVYLLLEDFVIKPIYLCCFKEVMRAESHAEKGYKRLRRVSEVVAETICQTVLQVGILLAYGAGRLPNLDPNNIRFVWLSLFTSMTVLILWGSLLQSEARGYGLRFYEYVTVILQGSFNFVPYLPAIERGKRHEVNWTDFRFDSHSVGLVSKALISPECALKSIKLSAYSLTALTLHECKFLGQMLADSPKDAVTCIFSRSRKQIESLFKQFDTDNSRTFDFLEFMRLCTALRQKDDGVVSALDVAHIFGLLADKERQEVYLTDLLWKIGHSLGKLPVVDYDSPVMYALKEHDSKLLTFMIAAKVCDDVTWEYYTTTLVTTGRHSDALMMTEERGVPIVVELISGHELPAHLNDNQNENGDGEESADPYASVSVADKVKRTDTIRQSLNPEWRQPLLFILPFEDIPAMVGKGAIGGSNAEKKMGYGQSSAQIRRASTLGGTERRRTTRHGREDREVGHHGHGQRGTVGGTTTRLEINFKIYDYDDADDDFFMGSYKHKIKWSLDALREHQSGSETPKEMTHKLTNRENAGRFKFRIFTGTLQHYLSKRKYGNKDRRR